MKEQIREIIENKFPCEVGQEVVMEEDKSYDEVRQANYFRRQGAIWMLEEHGSSQTNSLLIAMLESQLKVEKVRVEFVDIRLQYAIIEELERQLKELKG